MRMRRVAVREVRRAAVVVVKGGRGQQLPPPPLTDCPTATSVVKEKK